MPTNRILADPNGTSTSIDLVREPPFALAQLTVTPAALTIAAPGWSQRIEPRAMKVLVVLAQAAPAVVGRGELNARVWGGRVVGEDAINRAVQTLRRLAADAPAPVPFTIETVPRVGYRLAAGGGADATRRSEAVGAPPSTPGDPPPVAAPVASRRRWRAPVIMGAVGATLALLLAVVAWRGFGPADPAPAAWRITSSATLDDLPPGARDVALSPDGRRLAWRGQDARGRDRVFVRATGGGVGIPMSPADIDARRPAWSPDSVGLAFVAYDPGKPCRLFAGHGTPAAPVGACETARDPRLAWSGDGGSLLFGDASGENAVPRITAVRLGDGHRSVLSSPPGDSVGDDVPMARGSDIIFQRLFRFTDEGWIARDLGGNERVLWRRRGVAGSVAAPLPDGGLAVGWTQVGSSGLDLIDAAGHVTSQPVALGTVTALAIAGPRLLVETDRAESVLVRAGATPGPPLATVRGRIAAPVLLPDGRMRFPVASAGAARVWERAVDGAVRPWGTFVAARIVGLALSPDGRRTAALVTGDAGREIVVFDADGKPLYRWRPRSRGLNPGAWSADGRRLVTPVLDGAGWRLVALDPFGGTPPRDLDRPGFAVVQSVGPALYAVRAGESTGIRELWRLDGRVRRLPVDLTLFDIVNWRAVDGGVWVPDRRDPPRLVLRAIDTGRAIRSVPAPAMAGAKSGIAADARGPVYVAVTRDAPEYSILTLARSTAPDRAN